MTPLARGDLLPRIVTTPPGPRSQEISRGLAAHEAPGINTLAGGEPSLAWQEARGANVLDADGNRYIDLTSGFGVAAVGHRHPRVVAAVRDQAGRLLHGLGDVHSHPWRERLAVRLLELAPVDDGRVYFGISGAEAVEIALETALLATGRPGVLAFDPAYHGLTLGALAATSRPEFREPFSPWLSRHVRRLAYGCDPREIEALLAAEPTIGCAVVEPVIGREGVIFPPPGWLAELAERCRGHSVLLVADEIFTGFGRTGHELAVAAEGVRPDLLVCGKALGGGLPIAAVIGRRRLMDRWARPGEALHTATFVAHPLACAAALATLDVLAGERLAERAARLGSEIGPRVTGWTRFPAVDAVRGRGLLWGVELADRRVAGKAVLRLTARGILALAGGPAGRVLQIVPPLTIAGQQLSAALDILEQVLEAIHDG